MPRQHSYSAETVAAARALGLEIARARRERRLTLAELAERTGVTAVTLRQVERGAPSVALGTYFEAALLAGVDLFGSDRGELDGLVRRGQERLALLPQRVRRTERPVRDEF